MQMITEADGSMLMTFENETGTGRILAYEVFPGILLSYSDFQLECCESTYAQGGDMFGFEYCSDGKIEWEKQDGNVAFLGPGSFMPYDYERNSGRFLFPLHHYKGFSFGIQLPRAADFLPEGFPVDLKALKNQLEMGRDLDLSNHPQAEHLLGLVQAAEKRTDIHRKLACLELLLFLKDLKWTEHPAVPLYMPKAQVQKMRQVVEELPGHLEHRYTLDELSGQFHLPVTTLRRNFQAIYGCTVAEFSRKHRMEEARRLLRDTELSTSEIASRLGYDNPSKFAAAFRSVVQIAPQSYRAQVREQNGAC